MWVWGVLGLEGHTLWSSVVPRAYQGDWRTNRIGDGGAGRSGPADQRHSIALLAISDLYVWRWGEIGQLGHGGKDSLVAPRVVD